MDKQSHAEFANEQDARKAATRMSNMNWAQIYVVYRLKRPWKHTGDDFVVELFRSPPNLDPPYDSEALGYYRSGSEIPDPTDPTPSGTGTIDS